VTLNKQIQEYISETCELGISLDKLKYRVLRRNPPEVLVTNGQKLCTKIIYIVSFAKFCATALNIFSKKIISNNTKCRNKFWSSYETLESTDEMKLMMKFYLFLHQFSELWNLFSRVPIGNCLRYYFSQLYIYDLLKCKKDCAIPKIHLVQGFSPIKAEIARFSVSDFVLRIFAYDSY